MPTIKSTLLAVVSKMNWSLILITLFGANSIFNHFDTSSKLDVSDKSRGQLRAMVAEVNRKDSIILIQQAEIIDLLK